MTYVKHIFATFLKAFVSIIRSRRVLIHWLTNKYCTLESFLCHTYFYTEELMLATIKEHWICSSNQMRTSNAYVLSYSIRSINSKKKFPNEESNQENPLNMFLFCLFVYGFVCFRSQSRLFSLIWRRRNYGWRAANVDLCSALMAIEQWGFFSVPQLVWLGASIYNGHLQGTVPLTPIATCLVLELSLPVLTTKICRGLDSNIQPSACEAVLKLCLVPRP